MDQPGVKEPLEEPSSGHANHESEETAASDDAGPHGQVLVSPQHVEAAYENLNNTVTF